MNKNTISRYEAGAAILTATLEKLERALKAEGLIFMDEDDDHGPGVRLPKMTRKAGKQAKKAKT